MQFRITVDIDYIIPEAETRDPVEVARDIFLSTVITDRFGQNMIGEDVDIVSLQRFDV